METVFAYFAGLIDGEGCLHLAKRSDRPSLKPTIEVKMTCKEIIYELRRVFGGHVSFKPRGQEHWKDQWNWRAQNRTARECIEKIRPYLTVKRDEADKLLAYMSVERKKGRSPKSPAP
jgi:hypothetical protein